MRWYAFLFWAWALISVVILLRRRLGAKNAAISASGPTTRTPALSPVTTTPRQQPSTPTPDQQSLASLLKGIQLPCGLAPLTHSLGATSLDKVAIFATDSASYEETKKELGAEITRLGFELTPLDETTVRAHNNTGDLEIEFFSSTNLERDFSTAAYGSTVVEIRVAT